MASNININNDSYLIIVYGKDKDKVKTTPYNITQNKQSNNLFNKTLSTGTIGKVAMACVTSPIAQNLASKYIPSATLGRINSSINDIMADGKVSIAEVAEDFIGSCTNTIDNIATNMGFPTPSALYSAIMPNGTGVISKDFVNLFSKKAQGENKQNDINQNKNKVNILELKIITDDSESWKIDIPTRKTENGFEIATAISIGNKAKDYSVLLTTNTKTGTDMYQIKNQLDEIKNSQEPFDIYINDKDVLYQYQMKNCLFSNLDFKTEGKNALTCSMSIVEIPEWSVDFVKLTNYTTPSSSNSSKKNTASASSVKKGVSQSVSNVTNKVKTTGKTSHGKIQPVGGQTKDRVDLLIRIGKSNKDIVNDLKKHGLIFTEADIDAERIKVLTGK